MSATHLLDTSVFSQRLKARPIQSALDRWEAVGDERLVISVITEAEVLYGLAWGGASRQRSAYEQDPRLRLPILLVDSAVAASYGGLRAELRRLGNPVESMDLLIAATAHAHGLIVATLNFRHFENIPGIAVENWNQP